VFQMGRCKFPIIGAINGSVHFVLAHTRGVGMHQSRGQTQCCRLDFIGETWQIQPPLVTMNIFRRPYFEHVQHGNTISPFHSHSTSQFSIRMSTPKSTLLGLESSKAEVTPVLCPKRRRTCEKSTLLARDVSEHATCASRHFLEFTAVLLWVRVKFLPAAGHRSREGLNWRWAATFWWRQRRPGLGTRTASLVLRRAGAGGSFLKHGFPITSLRLWLQIPSENRRSVLIVTVLHTDLQYLTSKSTRVTSTFGLDHAPSRSVAEACEACRCAAGELRKLHLRVD
jgi:hypothetical protein